MTVPRGFSHISKASCPALQKALFLCVIYNFCLFFVYDLNYIMRSLLICTPHQIFFGWLNREEYPLASRQQYLFDNARCCMYSLGTPDDGRKDCPKHVECHSIVNTNTCTTSTSQVKIYQKSSKNSYMFRSSTIFRELQCPR